MPKTKNPVGRPKEVDTVKRYNITLDDKTHYTMQRLGEGNLSLGVREAARILRQLQVVGK